MRRIAWLLLVLAAAIPACGGPQLDAPRQAAEVKSTLDTLWTQYADAADRRDSLAFGPLFRDDAVLVYSSAPTASGRRAIEQFLVALYSGVDLTSLRVTPEDLRMSGNLGAQAGKFEEDYSDAGAAKTMAGRFALIVERGDDKAWRIRRLVMLADSVRAVGGAQLPQ